MAMAEVTPRRHQDDDRILQVPNKLPSPSSSYTMLNHGEEGKLSEERHHVKVNSRALIFLNEPMPLTREIVFFLVISTANFTPISGLNGPLAIIQDIGESLGVDNDKLPWLVASYGLSVGTLILFSGRLGDFFGHKKIFIIGNLWFAFFTLLCGICSFLPAHRYSVFLTARVLQGVGPAFCIPNAVALLGITYATGSQKAMMFAMFGAMAPISAILSPLFAALLAMVWLPAAFFGLAAVLILVALAAVFVVPRDQIKFELGTSRAEFRHIASELDIIGAVTGISGLALFSIACNLGNFDGWDKPYVLTLLFTGVIFLAAFVYVERHARRPLLPYEAISSGVIYVLAAVFCGWGCFGIWIYYTWEFYSVLRGASPLLATAWHSPILLCGICAALTTGFIIQRVGPAMVMNFALLAFTVGTVLIATAPVEQSYWLQTFLCNIIITWGMDLSFPAATLMLSDLVGPDHQGIAASLVTTVVNYSGALALGIAGAVEMRVHLADAGDHEDDGSSNTKDNLSSDPNEILRGYRAAWYLGIGLGVAGFIASASFAWVISRRKQRQQREERNRDGEQPQARSIAGLDQDSPSQDPKRSSTSRQNPLFM